MNDGPHTLNRDRARAILNRCAASIANITKTPVPTFHIPDNLGGNEGHPARRFTSAFGAAGCIGSALKDGNETSGAAMRSEVGGQALASVQCASAASVSYFSHDGELADV